VACRRARTRDLTRAGLNPANPGNSLSLLKGNALTDRRYVAYRRVRTRLGVLATEVELCAEERLLFEDCAEGLLLARAGDEEEVRSLRLKAAVGMSLLVGSGRMTSVEADSLYEQMTLCGPALERDAAAA
jgi:hypothetical protein